MKKPNKFSLIALLFSLQFVLTLQLFAETYEFKSENYKEALIIDRYYGKNIYSDFIAGFKKKVIELKPQIVLIGENHFVGDKLNDLYPDMIGEIFMKNEEYNCIFLETPNSPIGRARLERVSRGESTKDDLVLFGRSLARALYIVKKLNPKVLLFAADHFASHYGDSQLEHELHEKFFPWKSKEVVTSGASSPEGVELRDLTMAAEITEKLSNGTCNKAFFIGGAYHTDPELIQEGLSAFPEKSKDSDKLLKARRVDYSLRYFLGQNFTVMTAKLFFDDFLDIVGSLNFSITYPQFHKN